LHHNPIVSLMEWQEYQDTGNKAEVLRQLIDLGYDITQRTFYRHCKQGKCRQNPDGVFSRRLVRQYVEAEGLRRKGEAEDDDGPDVSLAIEKQRLENRKLEWANKKAQLDYEKAIGQVIEREAVYLEIAARWTVLNSSFLGDIVDEKSRELIVSVNGDLTKLAEFQDLLKSYWIDIANSFCTMDEFEVLFDDEQEAEA